MCCATGHARWDRGTESGMDNSQRFDSYDSHKPLLAVDLSSFVARESSLVARMLDELGNHTGATHWRAYSSNVSQAIHDTLCVVVVVLPRPACEYVRARVGGAVLSPLPWCLVSVPVPFPCLCVCCVCVCASACVHVYVCVHGCTVRAQTSCPLFLCVPASALARFCAIIYACVFYFVGGTTRWASTTTATRPLRVGRSALSRHVSASKMVAPALPARNRGHPHRTDAHPLTHRFGSHTRVLCATTSLRV